MGEHQQLVRVRELANEIIRLRLQDRTTYDELELQNNVELLSRSVVDLVNIMLAEDVDSSTSLKATASKMKMVYNNMHQAQAEKKDYLHF
ncbi:hypothetical protein ABET11_18770 [Priestia megaterium]|uniref:hypothetical protein n=1 Tax=Priestia megaterium TaxID=1404 RepID=UPI000BF4A7BB|nr:hypothetical protein [Priestia megaterium]PEW15425.1 hypothetical protein CN435_19275 [Priestia megaterium]PFL70675.1 hypothetical protein COJ36_03715 [Priestia megaterium]QCR26503.1 hypothetical protein C1N54_06475 [Priestia megaterium]